VPEPGAGQQISAGGALRVEVNYLPPLQQL
jgi:hypothetical protein